MSQTTTGVIGVGFTYSIGADTNHHELSLAARRAFLADVRAAVQSIDGTVLFSGQGLGVWEGSSEPAGSVTFTLEHSSDITERKARLREKLGDLAYDYSQDAIALTFGDTVLIEENETVVRTRGHGLVAL